jgi:hypothetical protein
MTNYDTYGLILCTIVLVLLTTLSIVCLWTITSLTVRLIRSGEDDDKILDEYNSHIRRILGKILKCFDYIFTGIVCLAFTLAFVCAVYLNINADAFNSDIPVYRVVQTGSMATKHEKNGYLVKNDLNDQIQIFDLIKTEKLPDEMDLELYDIVVYEIDGILIVHRIVGIEEPNEKHPDCRYFLLQGDAVESADRFPVLYEQMRAIYTGERIPYIGSFIMFLQSPAGWMCMALVVIAIFAAPLLDNYIKREKEKRIAIYNSGGFYYGQ